MEQAISADADAQIAALPEDCRSALVLSSDQWHQGVVGIVASRLSEKYGCPSFMIHLSDGNSDEQRFVREITELTGKCVYAANAGMTIDLSKTPY